MNNIIKLTHTTVILPDGYDPIYLFVIAVKILSQKSKTK